MPKRYNFLPTAANRESCTDVVTISAAGNVIPAFLILIGRIHLRSWYTNLDDDTMISVSDSGYTNNVLTLE